MIKVIKGIKDTKRGKEVDLIPQVHHQRVHQKVLHPRKYKEVDKKGMTERKR